MSPLTLYYYIDYKKRSWQTNDSKTKTQKYKRIYMKNEERPQANKTKSVV